ncbi:MAG: ABC transporter ATP-binding protein [Terriglobia bacterium]
MTSPLNNSVIRIEDVHKVYDLGEVKVPALRGISLALEPREFVAIMGASGSGKSTLMNIIGCLDRPSAGHYYLEGSDVSQLDTHARARIRNRKIGFVFQQFNLLARTTALENIELPTLYAGLSAEERHEQGHAVLALVGLDGRGNHLPSQLSGGEQQRVAIARALINHPSILLADEPTGNLDSRTSVEIMDLLERLNREQDLLVVLVTHEPDIAAYARRIVLVRDGRILRDIQVHDRQQAYAAVKDLHALPAESVS